LPIPHSSPMVALTIVAVTEDRALLHQDQMHENW
jgi:hypothetical protein